MSTKIHTPYRLFLAIALASVLWVVACRPTAEPRATSVTGHSPVPPTEPPVVPLATITVPPSATPSPVRPTVPPTATSTPVPPTEGVANADVLFVQAVQAADGTWTFHVTVQHPDTGWEDYADGWDVITHDDTIIKPNPDSPFTRLLLHPHENEQPFTRSQSGIVLPPGTTQVRVRAHDLVDGYGGREVLVDLTAASGPDFEVHRR